MLTSFRLGNFKAFRETQTIPLRPLTLIFGPNSSGKSSIIHGLLFAHEANRTGNPDVQRTQLGGNSVDLGGYQQFMYRSGQFYGSDVQCGLEIDLTRPGGGRADRLASTQRLGICWTIKDARLSSCVIEADGATTLRAGLRPRSDEDVRLLRFSPLKVRLEQIDQTHPVLQEAIRLISQVTPEPKIGSVARSALIDHAIVDLLSELVLVDRFFPNGVLDDKETMAISDELESSPLRHERNKQSVTAAVRLLFTPAVDRLLKSLSEVVTAELDRLSYLGPLRSYPPRHFIFEEHQDPNWLAGGGHAYDIARQDWRVQSAINEWLGDVERLSTPYELVAEHLWRVRDLESVILPEMAYDARAVVEDGRDLTGADDVDDAIRRETEDAIRNRFLERLTDLDAEGSHPFYGPSHLQIMTLRDKRTNTFVSHRDVGIGVSQVLPVLVHAYASENRIVAIEQPEIHLHPKLQAELADVFIESALGERKNMFILESHSEHLMLRVLRRIRETADGELPAGLVPIRPEDVAVLYVLPTPEGSKVIEIPIRPDGEFAIPWPDGFFPDRAKELF